MRNYALSLLILLLFIAIPAYPEEPNSVPGEIRTFSVSPDSQRVVLEVTSRVGDSYEYRLVLYNVVTEKIIASIDTSFYQAGPWSSDSRRVAIKTDDEGILILGRDGQVKRLKPRRPCGDLLWNPGTPGHIFYKAPFDSTFVADISLTDGKEKVVAKDRLIVSFYEAEGKAFYVEDVPIPGVQYASELQCREIGSGRLAFRLPLYRHGFDVYRLQLSPDGAYFFFNGTLSAGTLNVVGRVDDAGVVFKKYYRAILFQRAVEDIYEIIWPQQLISSGDGNVAIVQPHDEPSYFLDLESGSRRKVTEEPYSLSDGWLFISPEGLKRVKSSGETVLLIRHTPMDFH